MGEKDNKVAMHQKVTIQLLILKCNIHKTYVLNIL
jgi:hypothetical protein